MRSRDGFSLIEVLLVLALSSVILVSLGAVVGQGLISWETMSRRSDVVREADFAMQQMVRAVKASSRLLLPLAENPSTAYSESQRSVLALTLAPALDRNSDGFADADNDQDGNIDEDPGADSANDNASGIYGVDDNNDGATDDQPGADDDEDGATDEDLHNGLDDDGDGAIDEDSSADLNQDGQPSSSPGDDDGDGTADEDWYDVVLYRLDGSNLVERTPNLNPVDGRDFTERTIATHVTAFTTQRLSERATDRHPVLEISITIDDPEGEPYTISSTVRLGGGRL